MLAWVLVVGTGCGNDSGADLGPWPAAAVEASRHATTDFGRAALGDGVVSRA